MHQNEDDIMMISWGPSMIYCTYEHILTGRNHEVEPQIPRFCEAFTWRHDFAHENAPTSREDRFFVGSQL